MMTDAHYLIRQLIREEDELNPLSDSALQKELAKRGLNIARRTVAKYRNSLGLGGTEGGSLRGLPLSERNKLKKQQEN